MLMVLMVVMEIMEVMAVMVRMANWHTGTSTYRNEHSTTEIPEDALGTGSILERVLLFGEVVQYLFRP